MSRKRRSTWSKSINTKIFVWFLGDLSNNLKRDSGNKKPACFIFDNSSVHTNTDIKNFSEKAGIRWITIPPYSPQLNPCEKIIAIIKTKLRSYWIDGRPLNLSIMKKIIDEIDESIWRGWIKSAKLEIYKKLVIMKTAALTTNIQVDFQKIGSSNNSYLWIFFIIYSELLSILFMKNSLKYEIIHPRDQKI